jgi:hypothetical protein
MHANLQQLKPKVDSRFPILNTRVRRRVGGDLITNLIYHETYILVKVYTLFYSRNPIIQFRKVVLLQKYFRIPYAGLMQVSPLLGTQITLK